MDVTQARSHGEAFGGSTSPNFVVPVAAASLLIASRGGASPQKFEKRALTIFP